MKQTLSEDKHYINLPWSPRLKNKLYLFLVSSLFFSSFLPFVSLSHPKGHQETPFQIVSHDWQGEIPVNKLVIVKNQYGSIRSRSNSEEKVFMHATYQRIGHQGLSPRFDIKEMEGNLYITIHYDESINDSKGQLRGRTDISVLFPPSVKIIAETSTGMIKIDKTHSHVDAKTISGKIKLTTTGLFNVETESGDIHLRLRGMHTKGHSQANSKSGKITADIFTDMDIDLKAKAEGVIYLNGTKLKDGTYSYQHGEQGSTVNFKSSLGDIKINQVSPPELVKSVVPTKKKIDLRNLPKSKPWKVGDPTKDINPKRTRGKSKG